MFKYFEKMSETNQGLILVTAGTLLLLYILNFFHTVLPVAITLGSLFLIAAGVVKLGGVERIKSLLSKK